MSYEHFSLNRQMSSLKNKDTSHRELRKTLKQLELQRRSSLKDLDNDIHKFKSKYGHQKNSRRKSVSDVVCGGRPTLQQLGTGFQEGSSQHNKEISSSVSGDQTGRASNDRIRRRRHSLASVCNTKQDSLHLRKSDYRMLPSSEFKQKSMTPNITENKNLKINFQTKGLDLLVETDVYDTAGVAHTIRKGKSMPTSHVNKSLSLETRHNLRKLRILTRRNSEPEFHFGTNQRDKLRQSSNNVDIINLSNEFESGMNENDEPNVTSSFMLTEHNENADDIEHQKDSPKINHWGKVRESVVSSEKLKADNIDPENCKTSLFKTTLKLCPKIKKVMVFREDYKISESKLEEHKPKWQMMRRKSHINLDMIHSDQHRLSVTDDRPGLICPKPENHELEMATLKNLLNFRKGHKKVELVARLLNEHIRTDVPPPSNEKEGLWKEVLTSCRYLR